MKIENNPPFLFVIFLAGLSLSFPGEIHPTSVWKYYFHTESNKLTDKPDSILAQSGNGIYHWLVSKKLDEITKENGL